MCLLFVVPFDVESMPGVLYPQMDNMFNMIASKPFREFYVWCILIGNIIEFVNLIMTFVKYWSRNKGFVRNILNIFVRYIKIEK